MQKSNRARILKVVTERYHKWEPFGKITCTYCGWDGSTIDHIPSVSNSYNYGLGDYHHIIVPCCRECNSSLADIQSHTITDRAEYLYKKYEKKYKKLLDMPYWTNEEILTMGDNFQRQLRSDMDLQGYLEDRLTHLDNVMILYTNNYESNEELE